MQILGISRTEKGNKNAPGLPFSIPKSTQQNDFLKNLCNLSKVSIFSVLTSSDSVLMGSSIVLFFWGGGGKTLIRFETNVL